MASRPTSERELNAFFHNLNKERQLQKEVNTIKLEEDYTMKLLALGKREISTYQRRLKHR